ncbi:MAG: hypothetical protein AAF471_08795 [Myxococcota bacterium]
MDHVASFSTPTPVDHRDPIAAPNDHLLANLAMRVGGADRLVSGDGVPHPADRRL